MNIISQDKIDHGLYWTHSLTLVSGCTAVSEGCEHCWAAQMASRFPWGKGFAENGKWTGVVKPNYKALEKLELRAEHGRKLKPRAWQIWNDYLHPKIENRVFYRDTFESMVRCGYHKDIYLILTKHPENLDRLPNYESAMDHIYIGVSVESQKHINRIDQLIQNWPGKKFVSIEPCLGMVNLRPYTQYLDSVIIGCESGSKRRRPPSGEQLFDMLNHCKEMSTPVFLKQWEMAGELVKMPQVFGRHWDQLVWNEKGETG